MKVVSLEQAVLDSCIEDAQRERVVLTRNGKPVALLVGIEGMDEEQLQRASSDRFWKLIAERRAQRIINRAELEQKINNSGS